MMEISKAAQRQMILAGGAALAEKKAWVLHEPTLAMGQVKKFWDGEDEKYVSTINGEAVSDPVLELESGHALVFLSLEGFFELDAAAVRFYEALQAGLSGLVVVSARSAAASGVPQDVGFALTAAALRAQLGAIEAGASSPGNEAMG